MSGICGVIHFDDRPTDRVGLKAMVDAAPHRAPDGVAVWAHAGCAMAQLLTCLDTTARPPCELRQGQAGRYVIAGDVHLHDRETLRSALDGPRSADDGPQGCRQCTDADLVLRAYLRWGAECVGRLIGDYAFAIWDRRDRRVFAARDPMGLRPFYYHCSDQQFVFASEIGQILAIGRVPKRLNRHMAAAWLAVRPGDRTWTFYDAIFQLPGAHGLAADEHGTRVTRVWDIDPERRIVYRSEEEYVAEFRELLLTATRARLQSAYPAGMLLSGGIDSVAVAGATGWLDHHERSLGSTHPFTTFAYRYEGFPACDERHVSEPLARHWGMHIEEISSDAWRTHELTDRVWEVDSPAIGIYRPLQDAAMDRARSLGIRQLFVAARGDNMVGGYIWDHAGLLLSGALGETWRELQRHRSVYRSSLWKSFRKTIYGPLVFGLTARSRPLAQRRERRHEQRQARSLEHRRASGRLAAPWVVASLLHEIDLDTVFGSTAKTRVSSAATNARRNSVFDHFTELGNVQVERRAAEFGLRYEDPWSDRRILEFVCAVPQHVLNRVDDTKRLARRALAGLVPPEVQASARKIIPAPFGLHALRGREAPSLTALTTDMRAAQAGLVDEPLFAEHITSFLQGADLLDGAWPALTLEAWLRSHDIAS